MFIITNSLVKALPAISNSASQPTNQTNQFIKRTTRTNIHIQMYQGRSYIPGSDLNAKQRKASEVQTHLKQTSNNEEQQHLNRTTNDQKRSGKTIT